MLIHFEFCRQRLKTRKPETVAFCSTHTISNGRADTSTSMTTPYHAKYYAHDLTRRAASGADRLSMALFDAAVDLNPHQIEAALLRCNRRFPRA
jgi:hypothetical protein